MRVAAASALAAALLATGAVRAEDKTTAPAPVPIPYPDPNPTPAPVPSSAAAARDPQSGLPTGKRMHKPFVFSASDRKISLADGRTFVVSAQTGEVVFGDGAQGRRPETGNVPADGKYRLGGGAAGNVEVRAGRLLVLAPFPTPAPARETLKAK